MAHPRFHCPVIQKGYTALSSEETRHARGSRRLGVGDALTVFDGQGAEGEARIHRVDHRWVTLEITDVRMQPQYGGVSLTLATALPRTPRQIVLVEKCTELGVRSIWPIRCGRSVVLPQERIVERWRRTALEAAKQCGSAWVPAIEKPQSFESAMARTSEFDAAILAAPDESAASLTAWPRERDNQSLLAFVGPEGGWTEDELTLAGRSGATLVNLGPLVLRVETACLVIATYARLFSRRPNPS